MQKITKCMNIDLLPQQFCTLRPHSFQEFNGCQKEIVHLIKLGIQNDVLCSHLINYAQKKSPETGGSFYQCCFFESSIPSSNHFLKASLVP